MISSMDDDSLLELGTIGRPHGTRGEVVVRLVTNRTERLDTGSRLLSSEGELVVESSRPHQDKFLVRFEGFSSRTEAEQLRGVTLKGFPLDTPDVLWVHKLNLLQSKKLTLPLAFHMIFTLLLWELRFLLAVI